MGCFSWITSDTSESIPVFRASRKPVPVKMLMPDGTAHEEREYEGYGVFGGIDFYQAVHALTDNIPYASADRGKGIEYCNPCIFPHIPYEILEDLKRLPGGENDRFVPQEDGTILFNPKMNVIQPRLVSIGFTGSYEYVPDSKSCPDQGFFYPDSELETDEH